MVTDSERIAQYVFGVVTLGLGLGGLVVTYLSTVWAKVAVHGMHWGRGAEANAKRMRRS
jgi:hypothetical protein